MSGYSGKRCDMLAGISVKLWFVRWRFVVQVWYKSILSAVQQWLQDHTEQTLKAVQFETLSQVVEVSSLSWGVEFEGGQLFVDLGFFSYSRSVLAEFVLVKHCSDGYTPARTHTHTRARVRSSWLRVSFFFTRSRYIRVTLILVVSW